MKVPNPIRVATNAFANYTMTTRVPGIIEDVQNLNPAYPKSIMRGLDALKHALETGDSVPLLGPSSASNFDEWADARRAQSRLVGSPPTWHNCEWFFAETFFYRYLMQVVRWFETLRDPFAPKKQTELDGEALWQLLDMALQVKDRLYDLLAYALWGNRIDLSYAAAAEHGAHSIDAGDLLVDDREAVLRHLHGVPAGTVHVIADNTGSELAMDLVLIDRLLAGVAEPVFLHLKAHPTFVSDATPVDVWRLLDAMAARGDGPSRLAGRLRAAWDTGRLRLAQHVYWNSSRFLWDMPAPLLSVFRDARLVVLKGDANYRRAVGDALWDAAMSFGEVVHLGIDAPVLALRTLKSDTVVGLPSGLADRLDQEDENWRTNGRRGVIQFAR